MSKKMGYVYFIRRQDDTGPVKIGYSKNPDLRIKSYLNWSPEPLKLIGYIISEKSLENKIHRHLNEHRLHHEWFDWSGDVKKCVTGLIDGTITPLDIPEAQPIPAPERNPCEWTKSMRSELLRVVSISGRSPSCQLVKTFVNNNIKINDYLPEMRGIIKAGTYAFIQNPVANGVRKSLPNSPVYDRKNYKPLYLIYSSEELKCLHQSWLSGGPATPAYPDPYAHLETEVSA